MRSSLLTAIGFAATEEMPTIRHMLAPIAPRLGCETGGQRTAARGLGIRSPSQLLTAWRQRPREASTGLVSGVTEFAAYEGVGMDRAIVLLMAFVSGLFIGSQGLCGRGTCRPMARNTLNRCPLWRFSRRGVHSEDDDQQVSRHEMWPDNTSFLMAPGHLLREHCAEEKPT